MKNITCPINQTNTNKKPIKVTVTRIQEIFEKTNPYRPNSSIIKDYVYSDQKKVLI